MLESTVGCTRWLLSLLIMQDHSKPHPDIPNFRNISVTHCHKIKMQFASQCVWQSANYSRILDRVSSVCLKEKNRPAKMNL